MLPIASVCSFASPFHLAKEGLVVICYSKELWMVCTILVIVYWLHLSLVWYYCSEKRFRASNRGIMLNNVAWLGQSSTTLSKVNWHSSRSLSFGPPSCHTTTLHWRRGYGPCQYHRHRGSVSGASFSSSPGEACLALGGLEVGYSFENYLVTMDGDKFSDLWRHALLHHCFGAGAQRI